MLPRNRHRAFALRGPRASGSAPQVQYCGGVKPALTIDRSTRMWPGHDYPVLTSISDPWRREDVWGRSNSSVERALVVDDTSPKTS